MADLVLRQRIIAKKYGMNDKRLTEAINDITSAFCSRTFASMMPLVLEVLNNMTKTYDIERETVCLSFGRPV